MKGIITGEILKLEREYNVTVLLACETGSRAWGFPSPDSDYDIRLIYKHDLDWYLSLNEKKDTIDLMLDNNMLDISGWDIKKSLGLLWKSNPPLLERLQSPIIYKSDPEFVNEMWELASETYSRIASLHHYKSLSVNMFEEISATGNYKLKKLFYALRAATACKWIIDRDDIPPIEFRKMMEGLNIKSELEERIVDLIKLKSKVDESYFHKGEEEIFKFIESNLNLAETHGRFLPAGEGDMVKMNDFFRRKIKDED